MAVQAGSQCVHFLVLFSILSSSILLVKGLEQFYGSCGSTYDLMQTNTQSAILKVAMPASMKEYQDPTRNIQCDIIITFTHGMNLLIELYFLDIIPLSSERKSCITGLEIFDQQGRKYYGSRLCMEAWEWEEQHQQMKQPKLVVESSPLTFRLISGGPYKGEGFRVHINQFRPYWPCYTREFRCEQVQRCVHDDLTCDGWDDCGDNSDEMEDAGCHLLTASEICGIIIGILLLLGTVVGTVLFCWTYNNLRRDYGMRSESKIPISMDETKSSIDVNMSFPRRYNSKESLGVISRSSAPTMRNRQYSENSLDKADLEKADGVFNKASDNTSERSYRSNPKRTQALTQSTDEPEPIKKSGQYSYRKGRNSSQTSLNRDKGNPPINGVDNDGMGSNRGSQEKERLGSRDRDRRSPDRDRRYDSDEERRYRRRSRDRSRDRYYSDEDSDYERDRERRRRRRSYDRYSDEDSDYEYERERRRRSRDRYRDRYDRDDSDVDRPSRSRDDKAPGEDDLPPRRRDSRERDRYRDRDYDRRRSPYDDDDDDDDRPRRRSRRSYSGDRKRDSYRDSYDDDYRRRRSPDRKRNDAPPPYEPDIKTRSKENLDKHDDEPLPPPPTGEEIRRMELAKQLAEEAKPYVPPPKEKWEPLPKPKPLEPSAPAIPPVTEPIKSQSDPQRHRNDASKSQYEPAKPQNEQNRQRNDAAKSQYEPAKPQNNIQGEPPKQKYVPPKSQYEPAKSQYELPKSQYEPPKSQYEPAKQQTEPPKAKWEPPAKNRESARPAEQPKAEPVDDNTRRRSTNDRRERYSKNRWTPKSRHEDSPPPVYEDVAPASAFVKIGYKEESV